MWWPIDMRFWLILGLALLLSGCGYQPIGRTTGPPQGVETVYIPLFVNRSLEPFLENLITQNVIEELSRRQGMRVVEDAGRADARLEGEILSFRADAVSFGPDDRIGQYRAAMTIGAVLRRTDTGMVLWKGQLSWSQLYPVDLDKSIQEDNEQAALRVISRRLAENLYFRLHDNF
jgi:hypothetical protein